MPPSNRYTYDSVAKAKIYILLVFFGPLILLLLFLLTRFAVAVISGDFFQSIGAPVTYLLLLLFLIGILSWLAFVGFGFATLVNFEPDVQVSEQGLYIQFFLFWWRFIPWEDIEAIRPTTTSHILRNSSKIVLVKSLTPLHYYYGLLYAERLKPAFLIRRRMRSFDDLCQIIEAKIHPSPNHKKKGRTKP